MVFFYPAFFMRAEIQHINGGKEKNLPEKMKKERKDERNRKNAAAVCL